MIFLLVIYIIWKLYDHFKNNPVFFSVLPLNWTVGMVGILAGTIEDAFIVSVIFPICSFFTVAFHFLC